MSFNAPEKNNPFIDKKTIGDKTKIFVEKTKKAVKDALNKTGQKIRKVAGIGAMAGSSLGSPTFVATTVPASIETVSTISPLASTTINTIALTTAGTLLTACGPEEEEKNKDTTPPTIFMDSPECNISGSKQISIDGNRLYLGGELLATWTDNVDNNCSVTITFNGQKINSGTMIDKSGTLTLTVTDKSGNSKTQNIKINMSENIDSPEITLNKSEINILGAEKVNISNNQLVIGDETVASWTDKSNQNCTVSLKFNDNEIKSGDTIEGNGKLILTVTNNKGKTSTVEIIVKNEVIYGLENLKNLNLKVDQEIDLLQPISFAEGITLVKTQIEIDGTRHNISDPSHFTPEYPGNCNIIFTVQSKNGNTAEIKSDNLVINALDYQSMEIRNIQPKEILPIIGQINSGDRNAYEHIEHLRIAECTRIRDMMRKYGAGNYSPEQYQQLMLRLNTGMIGEKPAGFDNYEIVGKDFHDESEHGHDSRDILNTIIKHANFKVLEDHGNSMDELYQNLQNNSINIFAQSIAIETDSKENYKSYDTDFFNLKKYIENDNFLRFIAGTNLRNSRKKIYQENYTLPDEVSIYATPESKANSKTDSNITKHIFLTIGTNSQGNTDISNQSKGSKFPIGFHSNVLFSGRSFPYNCLDGDIYAADGNYTTSHTNYTNLAMACLIYQMKADISNVPELMSMIRDTSLTDQIHLDGQTQDLHLINPAGVAKKELMPNSIPSQINEGAIISLQEGFYKGIIFDIPGAEVYINGEWIPYNKQNQSLIKSQNPFNKQMKWRLNGKLAKKMGYNQNNPIKGKIIMVDESRNGLNISKDVSINIK